MKNSLKQFLLSEKIDFKEDVQLSTLTKIQVRARTDILVKPKDLDVFITIIKFAIQNSLKFDVIGLWSNTYFKDSYQSDLVILTGGLKKIEINEGRAICETGVRLASFARMLSKQGITGYEGLTGVPGTVGAAAINNSGSCGSCMEDLVESVLVLKENLELEEYDNKALSYGDRNSALKSGLLGGYVLKVVLKADQHDDISKIKKRIDDNNVYRLKSIDGQRKSLGSVFVSSGLSSIRKRYAFRLFIRRIIFALCLLFVKDRIKINKIRVYLIFLFLGHPKIAKHCDSLNRFCWEKSTKESDFYEYIDIMNKLSKGQIKLEIQVKE